jgi:hypothetical protein
MLLGVDGGYLPRYEDMKKIRRVGDQGACQGNCIGVEESISRVVSV